MIVVCVAINSNTVFPMRYDYAQVICKYVLAL